MASLVKIDDLQIITEHINEIQIDKPDAAQTAQLTPGTIDVQMESEEVGPKVETHGVFEHDPDTEEVTNLEEDEVTQDQARTVEHVYQDMGDLGASESVDTVVEEGVDAANEVDFESLSDDYAPLEPTQPMYMSQIFSGTFMTELPDDDIGQSLGQSADTGQNNAPTCGA